MVLNLHISVVIPTCGRPELLRQCLRRLTARAQEMAEGTFEVIVTDDGRPEQWVKNMLAHEFPAVRWTAGRRCGPAANRNHGATLATGEVLVFLDDDCLPSARLLAEYARAFQADPNLAAAEGRIVADRKPQRMDEESPINETGGLFWSCNVAVRAAAFRRLGGFDERFPHAAMEDVEFRSRLHRAGLPPVFLSTAEVVHPLRRMGGWQTVRRRAAAHGIYMRLETAHMGPFTFGDAVRRFARAWWRGILPGLWHFRGRGAWKRVRNSVFPFLCAWEMRQAARLPKMPAWPVAEPAPEAKQPPGP